MRGPSPLHLISGSPLLWIFNVYAAFPIKYWASLNGICSSGAFNPSGYAVLFDDMVSLSTWSITAVLSWLTFHCNKSRLAENFHSALRSFTWPVQQLTSAGALWSAFATSLHLRSIVLLELGASNHPQAVEASQNLPRILIEYTHN